MELTIYAEKRIGFFMILGLFEHKSARLCTYKREVTCTHIIHSLLQATV